MTNSSIAECIRALFYFNLLEFNAFEKYKLPYLYKNKSLLNCANFYLKKKVFE